MKLMSAGKPQLPMTLFLKSLIVRTPLADVARKLRWLLDAKKRRKHPELWEMYLEKQRMPLVLEKVLEHNACCIDVGGHIGLFLSLLNRYAPHGEHTVFEASPTKSNWLRKRFPNARVFSYAVADKAGSTIFEEDCARPGYSALREVAGQPAANSVLYEVPTCRLDDVLSATDRIDLMKFDIEGGELAALRGAAQLIRKWKSAIIFECGDEYKSAERPLSRRLELYDFVTKGLGYDIFSMVDFLYDKGEMSFDEFRKCGLYPFRGFKFVALHQSVRTSDSKRKIASGPR